MVVEVTVGNIWDKRINNCLRMRRKFRSKNSWGYCFWNQTLAQVLAKARSAMTVH
jgi:hypothetical protein